MKDLLLRNCLILNIDKKDYIKSDILIQNGKIKLINTNLAVSEQNMKIIDVKENYALPGLIDCHTHLGIIEEATGKIGVDNNETSNPVTPQLRAIDAINPFDIAFKDALKSGITTIMCTPGSDNAVGGINSVIKTYGTIIDKMIVKHPLALKISLGENPITMYGENKRCPVTRMGTSALIRELFMRGQDYLALKESGNLKERNIKLEAVIPLLKNEIGLRIHAHRADDIVTAIRIVEEFNIQKAVIEHGTEAYLIKEYIKEKNIPIAFGPMLTPRIKMELRNRLYGSVCDLVEAGIKVALITDHPYNSIDQLRTVAILSVSEGLSMMDAIKCITSNPAEILACEDRIGKLTEGMDGDIAIFDGDPLNINSKVAITVAEGEVVYNKSENQ